MVERAQVLAPVAVERLQHHRALELVQRLASTDCILLS